jgi:hypothetical protein
VHIDEPITKEWIATAGQLLDAGALSTPPRVEVRRRHVTAREASKTTITEAFGIGPVKGG